MGAVFQDALQATEFYNELTLIPSFHAGDAALLEYSGFVTRPKESSLVPCEVDQHKQKYVHRRMSLYDKRMGMLLRLKLYQYK